jgi:flagellar hook-basal body protein
MSFYTALTGLNAATAQLGVTSNNIANVGTTGFKRSRADFGDIFATSPLQKASSVIGQGVALKSVTQEFSQGNIQFSASSLDIAITGDGFFPLKSADGLQDIYTRNGTFLLDDSFAVVNSAGQALMAASVDSSGKADLENLRKLIIPRSTTGDARETTEIELSLNVPADGQVITAEFDPLDPSTYNLTTAVTVFDAGGNEYLATVYYAKTQRASPDAPENKWQTHVYIGDTKLDEFLIQASDNRGEALYVNKYGQVQPESAIPPQDIARGVTKLFNLDRLTDKEPSVPAEFSGQAIDPIIVADMKAGQLSVFDRLFEAEDETSFDDGLVTVDISDYNASAGTTDYNMFRIGVTAGGSTTTADIQIDLSLAASTTSDEEVVLKDLIELIQAEFDTAFTTNAPTVSFNHLTREFLFTPKDQTSATVTTYQAGTVEDNDLFGIPKHTTGVAVSDTGDFGGSTSVEAKIAVTLRVDNSPTPVRVELGDLFSHTALPRSGVELARILENRINKAYGDQRTFDFSDLESASGSKLLNLFNLEVDGVAQDIQLDLNGKVDALGNPLSVDTLRVEDFERVLQEKLTAVFSTDAPAFSYSPSQQKLIFVPSETATSEVIKIKAYGTSVSNELFGLTSNPITLDPDSNSYSSLVVPNGDPIREFDARYSDSDQRTGIRVRFDDTTGTFSVFSGTTGDESSVEILYPLEGDEVDETEVNSVRLTADSFDADVGRNKRAFLAFQALFNFPPGDTPTRDLPTRGVRSLPASVVGTPIGLNLDNKFTLSSETNKFTVTVDNVTGLIELPIGEEFTKESFRELLELRINSLEDSRGRTVNGVSVAYETVGTTTRLNITTGTEGDDSFLKVTGPSIWGLQDLPSGRGSTERWLVPPQAENANGVPLYVDRDGNETTQAGDFSEDETRELWSPIFLDKGELTFNTAGNLVSPRESIAFKATTIGDTGATLQFSINYDGSTQFSSPFSVLAQDQNGRPEGDLIGLDIGDDGLVSANYSNGSQKNLAKVVLANFSAPTGLRQIGDASYYATSKSGATTLGEAGTAGFGTVRAGARERANVDLTQELIELITAQRNFQANAKAIETNNTLTQAIINIRS